MCSGGECLVDLQLKVAQVMKSIGFALDHLDFVVDPFQQQKQDAPSVLQWPLIFLIFPWVYRYAQKGWQRDTATKLCPEGRLCS
jgi:hypothetical protein